MLLCKYVLFYKLLFISSCFIMYLVLYTCLSIFRVHIIVNITLKPNTSSIPQLNTLTPQLNTHSYHHYPLYYQCNPMLSPPPIISPPLLITISQHCVFMIIHYHHLQLQPHHNINQLTSHPSPF